MKKKIRMIVLSIFTIFMLSSFFHLEQTEKAFGHIITLLSIITGFCITALSIIATSNFAKDLYRQEDPDDNSRTLLHNLTDMFKYCILSSAFAIVLILTSFYLVEINFCKFEFYGTYISIKTTIVGGIWFATIISLIRFVYLVFMYSKFVIQSAKRQI